MTDRINSRSNYRVAIQISLAIYVVSTAALFAIASIPIGRVPGGGDSAFVLMAASLVSNFVTCYLLARYKGRSALLGLSCGLLNFIGMLILAVLPRSVASTTRPVRLGDLPLRRRALVRAAMAVPFLLAGFIVPWHTCVERYMAPCKSLPPYGWDTLPTVIAGNQDVNGVIWLLQFACAAAVAYYIFKKATTTSDNDTPGGE